MTDTTSKSGFGNASLADRVVAAYADGADALTPEECASLSFDADQCAVLQAALGKGKGGIVTDDEQAGLAASGFSQEFIDELAGSDGKNALNARVKWFAEEFRPCSFGFDKSGGMIEEMGEIGRDSPPIILHLVREIVANCNPQGEKALTAIKNIGAAAVPQLIKMLNKKDLSFEDRRGAIEALGAIGSDAILALPELISALKDKDITIRYLAGRAIGNMGPAAKDAIPALIEDLDRPWSFYTINSTLDALGKMGPDAAIAVPAMMKYAIREYYNSKILVESIKSIGPAAIPQLIRVLKGCNSFAVFPLIQNIFTNEDEDFRIIYQTTQVISELSEFGPWAKDTTDALIEALDSNDEIALSSVMGAIGAIGPDAKAAIPRLIELLDSDNPERVMSAAASALGKIGPASIPDLMKIFDGEDVAVMAHAADALGKIGSPALPELEELLNRSNPAIRAAAAMGLGKVGPEAVFLLISTLNDIDPIIRKYAAISLGDIGKDARFAIPYLDRMLANDENPDCSKAAEKALKEIQKEIL